MEKLLRQSLIEDQANYEEKIFSGRHFSDLQKYIHKIKGSRQFPKKMHLDDVTEQRRIQQKLNFSTNISQALFNRMINTFPHLSLSHPRLPVGPDKKYAPNS